VAFDGLWEAAVATRTACTLTGPLPFGAEMAVQLESTYPPRPEVNRCGTAGALSASCLPCPGCRLQAAVTAPIGTGMGSSGLGTTPRRWSGANAGRSQAGEEGDGLRADDHGAVTAPFSPEVAIKGSLKVFQPGAHSDEVLRCVSVVLQTSERSISESRWYQDVFGWAEPGAAPPASSGSRVETAARPALARQDPGPRGRSPQIRLLPRRRFRPRRRPRPQESPAPCVS